MPFKTAIDLDIPPEEHQALIETLALLEGDTLAPWDKKLDSDLADFKNGYDIALRTYLETGSADWYKAMAPRISKMGYVPL